MSLWTPDGERPVSRSSAPPTGGAAASDASPELREALAEAGIDVDSLTPEQLADAGATLREMAQVRSQMLSVPAADVIANHLMGIYELGAIHLGENPPNFDEAAVAIEALRAVLDRLAGAFGENEVILKQAVSQLQMAFVQLKEQVTQGGSAADTPAADTPAT